MLKLGRDDRVYTVCLSKEAVAASTWYILLDLSDTTNYDHKSGLTSFNILSLDISAEKGSDGVYDIWVGPVLENDGTNGTAQWIACWHMEASGNPTDSTDRLIDHIDRTCSGVNPKGVDCSVVSGATPYISGGASGDQTALKNDAANLASAAGGSSLSAVAGDIVVWVEEVSDAGTIDLFLTVQYTVN